MFTKAYSAKNVYDETRGEDLVELAKDKHFLTPERVALWGRVPYQTSSSGQRALWDSVKGHLPDNLRTLPPPEARQALQNVPVRQLVEGYRGGGPRPITHRWRGVPVPFPFEVGLGALAGAAAAREAGEDESALLHGLTVGTGAAVGGVAGQALGDSAGRGVGRSLRGPLRHALERTRLRPFARGISAAAPDLLSWGGAGSLSAAGAVKGIHGAQALLKKESEYTDAQRRHLERRFDTLAHLVRERGAKAGTNLNRILIPEDKLTRQDLEKVLGFQRVLIAVPEAGQSEFSSYRHRDNNFHLHRHPRGWVMHEDRHPSSTMLMLKAQDAKGKARAFVQGTPHLAGEGLPGMLNYIRGAIAGRESTADEVWKELAPDVRRRLERLSASPTWQEKQASLLGFLGVGAGFHLAANAGYRLFQKTPWARGLGQRQMATGIRHGLAGKKMNPLVDKAISYGIGPEWNANYEVARNLGVAMRKNRVTPRGDAVQQAVRAAQQKAPNATQAPILRDLPGALQRVNAGSRSMLDRLPVRPANAPMSRAEKGALGVGAAGLAAVDPSSLVPSAINVARDRIARSSMGRKFMERQFRAGAEGQPLGKVREELINNLLSPAALDPRRVGSALRRDALASPEMAQLARQMMPQGR